MRIAIVAVALAGCIEGPDPGTCTSTSDCDNGQACGAVGFCTAPSELRTVTVRWTIDGVAPTAEMPGRCAETRQFTLSITDDAGHGRAPETSCAGGMERFVDAPRGNVNLNFYVVSSAGVGLGELDLTVPPGDDTETLAAVTFH